MTKQLTVIVTATITEVTDNEALNQTCYSDIAFASLGDWTWQEAKMSVEKAISTILFSIENER